MMEAQIDPRSTQWRAFRDFCELLCADPVLLPPDGETIRRDNIEKVAHWSDIELSDFPRLAALTDGFTRFLEGGGSGASVISPWSNGGSGEPFQIDGRPCDRAIDLVKEALSRKLPIEDLADPIKKENDVAELAPAEASALVPANDNVPRMHPDPFAPEAAGGLLEAAARWITSTAIIPVPELSLAASIALLAGIFGKVALTPTRAGVNVYITTLLGTAGGKGWPAKAIRTLSDQPGTAGAVTNGDPTSYAALERILRKQSSTVIVMDEFGITLQDVNAKHKNSVAAGIRKFLLAVYDQSNSVFDGRVYASSETKKDEAPIVGPALTVLGMTTVETLYAGLSEASVADGFLNRFLFVTAAPPSGTITPPGLDYQTEPPKELLAAIAKSKASFPRPDGGKFVVPMEGGEGGGAYRRWGEIFVWQQSDKSELAGRAAENTIRLATLRAISRNPGDPVVSVDDVEWGWAIVFSSVRLITDGAKQHMSASPAEALRKAILAALADAPSGLPYSKLTVRRGVSGANSRELLDALIWLIASEQIEDTSDRRMPGAGSKFRSKTN